MPLRFHERSPAAPLPTSFLEPTVQWALNIMGRVPILTSRAVFSTSEWQQETPGNLHVGREDTKRRSMDLRPGISVHISFGSSRRAGSSRHRGKRSPRSTLACRRSRHRSSTRSPRMVYRPAARHGPRRSTRVSRRRYRLTDRHPRTLRFQLARWTHLELALGLELHVRDDASPQVLELARRIRDSVAAVADSSSR
jgi:hypothetical protein